MNDDKIDHDEAIRHLRMICDGHNTGHVCGALGISPRWSETGRYQFAEFHTWELPVDDDPNRLLREIEQQMLAEPTDVYVGPAVRHGRERKKGTARPLSLLWFDLDGPPADAVLFSTLDPVLIHSGREGHLHGYVRLDRSVDLDLHARLNKSLAHRLGADAKWSDESLLRLAGTVNHKTGASVAFA